VPLALSLPDGKGSADQIKLAPAAPQLNIGGKPLVLVRMARRCDAGRQPEALRAAFGLTPAEARALAALVAGESIKRLAQARGISVHTVRSQIAALMGKMGCSRQVDLVRAALHVDTA